MNRMIPILVVCGAALIVYSGASLIQALIWMSSWTATVLLARRFLTMMYPSGPRPVSEGEIEDAVLVFTFSETWALNHGYVIAWGASLLASVLVL